MLVPATLAAIQPETLPARRTHEDLRVARVEATVSVMRLLDPAVPAMRDDPPRLGVVHLHPDAFVEHIAEPLEVAAAHLGILPVRDDATVELIDAVEALPAEIAGKFFAADPARAVGEELFPAQLIGMLVEPSREVAEVFDGRAERALESPQIGLVEVPSVSPESVFGSMSSSPGSPRVTISFRNFTESFGKTWRSAGSTLKTISAVSGSARIVSM
jgi:hypothetical protein